MSKTRNCIHFLAFMLLLCVLLMTACDKQSDGLKFTTNGDGTCSVSGIGTCTDLDIVIPSQSPEGDSVKSIDQHAFYGCSNLTSIVIPDSVTSIGTVAFFNCSSLTSISIPDSVESIGEAAFLLCSSLNKIVVEKGNPNYHSDKNCLIETNSKTLILGCKNSVIPADGSVINIGNGAFGNCTGLTSIVIPNSVTSIEGSAFGGCSNLTSIVIPDSVTNIGANAFIDCTNFIVVENDIHYADKWAVGCDTAITEVVWQEGTIGIANTTFHRCNNLTSIVIPDSIKYIGNSAFKYCSSLSSVDIGDSVTSIGDGAFEGCYSLTSIVIPDSIKYIGNSAFKYCSSLSSVDIGDSVTSIGDGAFEGCYSLTSIVVPNSVTSIGELSFSECPSLTDIYFTGTEDEWNAIEKGNNWDSNTGSYTIHYNYVPD